MACTSIATATPALRPVRRARRSRRSPARARPLLSADQRLAFFDLRPAAKRLAANTTAPERAKLAEALLHPVELGYGSGFSYQEVDNGAPLRWAGGDSQLTLDNPRAARRLRLTATLSRGGGGTAKVTITLPGGALGRRRDRCGHAAERDVRAAPHGETAIRLQTDAAPVQIPGDDRDVRLRVVDPRVEDVELQQPRYVAAATP